MYTSIHPPQPALTTHISPSQPPPPPLPSSTHPHTYRLSLLQEVQRLAQSLGAEGDVSYTCETAEYFRLYQVGYLGLVRIDRLHTHAYTRVG
jgi:hypothetical protein